MPTLLPNIGQPNEFLKHSTEQRTHLLGSLLDSYKLSALAGGTFLYVITVTYAHLFLPYHWCVIIASLSITLGEGTINGYSFINLLLKAKKNFTVIYLHNTHKKTGVK